MKLRGSSLATALMGVAQEWWGPMGKKANVYSMCLAISLEPDLGNILAMTSVGWVGRT